jgi:Hint domain
VIPCFTPGALVETDRGPVPVEKVAIGDRVLTRDSGYRPVRWCGRRDLTLADVIAQPDFRPVTIRAGALGPGLPERDLTVSPQHRMLLTGAEAELVSGESEVLAAALHLVGRPGIDRRPAAPVSYVHFMFDQHEIVRVDGAWSESFQPGQATLDGLGEASRDEIFALFPALATEPGLRAYASARLSLKAHEVRAMMAA